MTPLIRSSLLVFALTVHGIGSNSSQEMIGDPFDTFGDVNCESEMARLDNFAVSLQNYPAARGQIIFFAGKMAVGRLPKRGEAEARVERMRSYLVKRRGIPAASLVVMNGGYGSEYRIQLWIVPPEADLAKPETHTSVKKVRYRKGKLNPRDYRCGI